MYSRKSINEISASKGSKFIFLNARSVIANANLLNADFQNTQITCINITESWLNDKIPDNLVEIPNYTLVRLDRQVPKRGGGIIVYINKQTPYTTLPPSQNFSNKDIECLTIKLSPAYQQPFYITTVYIPPKADITVAINTIIDLYDTLDIVRETWILGGDFNIDYDHTTILDKPQNKFKMNALNRLERHCLVKQIILTPTRYTATGSTTLDLIYTNKSEYIADMGVIPYGVSDHELTYCIHKKETITTEYTTFTARNMKNYDRETLEHLYSLVDWTPLYESRSPDFVWNKMITQIVNCVDLLCPYVTMNKVKRKEDWVDPLCLASIRKRDAKKHQLLTNYTPENKRLFNKARNNCKRKVSKAKANFLKSKIEENADNPKKLWQNLKILMPSKKGVQHRSELDLTNTDTGQPLDKNEMADYANKYFVTVGKNLAQKINSDNSRYLAELKDYADVTPHKLNDLPPISESEVRKQVKKIDNSKTSNVKGISTKLLKEAFAFLTPQLTYLFNLILVTCTIPLPWKTATVTPIFKDGDRSLISNYRPISVLPLPVKLLEKLIHQRLYNYLESHSLLCGEQGGFRPNLGTDTAISKFLEFVYDSLNEHKTPACIYFDLKKAFDTIDHKILLLKLKTFGIKNNAFKFLQNYISDRKQITIVNNSSSLEMNITHGVPQGSTLGPLLFILYINDAINCFNGCAASLYADDTVIYNACPRFKDTISTLNLNANCFAKWCAQNRLTVNTKKSKCMLFANRHNNSYNILKKELVIKIGTEPLEAVSQYKYLGLQVDDTCTFVPHVKYISRTVTSKLFILYKIRACLNKQHAMLLYKTSILPYFDIGQLYYDSCTKAELAKLQSLQNRCLKVIYTKKKWPGHETAQRESNLLPLHMRRNLNLLTLAQKLSFIDENLEPQKSYKTRYNQQKLLKLIRPKTKKYEDSFIHKSKRDWNKLKTELKEIQDARVFKTRLKLEMASNPHNFPT